MYIQYTVDLISIRDDLEILHEFFCAIAARGIILDLDSVQCWTLVKNLHVQSEEGLSDIFEEFELPWKWLIKAGAI